MRASPPTEADIVETFLFAYRQGAFPMAEPSRTARGHARARRRIDWFIPDPRAIIRIDRPINAQGGFHLSRSLRRTLRRGRFVLTADRAFSEVINACAAPTVRSGRDDTWLDQRLIDAYIALHRAGHAHSVEAWLPTGESPETPPVLVGGIYGVAIGSVFCAESMFCRPELGGTDASKVCLAFLVRHLQKQAFTLLDVQIANRHTERFGVVEIAAADYLKLLAAAGDDLRSWGTLQPDWRIDTPSESR